MGETGNLCVACGKLVTTNSWICRCGAIMAIEVLKHDLPADPLPLPLARAPEPMDSQPTPVVNGHDDDVTNPIGINDMVTHRFDPVEALSEIFLGRVVPAPVVDGSFDDNVNLSPIEVFLLTRIDGERGADDLGRSTGLKRVEMSVMLLNLLRAGAIRAVPTISIATQGGDGEWSVRAGEVAEKQAKDRATKEFSAYESELAAGNVNAATLHLKRSLASRGDAQVAELLEKHLSTVVSECDTFYRDARAQIAGSTVDQALATLDTAVKRFPGEAGLYNLTAVAILTQGGDEERALSLLRHAVDLDPGNEFLRSNLHDLEQQGIAAAG